MSDPTFRAEQEAGRYAAHVRPVNELVDSLRDEHRGWMPHVAPLHGGIGAGVLSVLRDPGPATQDGSGSGFLCIENDDPTAERQLEMFDEVGVTPGDITPWNAYPWYINAAPKAAQLDAGVEPLVALLDLMTNLRAVFLQGNDARNGWSRLVKRYPDRARKVETVIATFHPGRQALFHPDPDVRRSRVEHRAAAYRELAGALDRG
ncbi:uracil-DNA glycosylase [Pseudonocardia tropica]|uniref:Uracil-DNA glycosylase n=1 Tax=Pseudonocardia tropica TaxID=681289 RepID=A0ABV1JZJ3_9PSEU